MTGSAVSALPPSLHSGNNFDFLRLAMAVLIIFSHSFPLATGRQLGNVPDLGALGTFALAVFFSVSGYLIAMSWDRSRGLIDFLRRRVLRIFPGFLVAFFITSWLIAPFVVPRAPELFHAKKILESLGNAAALNAPNQSDAFASNPYPGALNVSLWSIHYEFGCYLLIAALGVLGALRVRWLVVGLLLASWTADVLIHRGLVHTGLVGAAQSWPRFLTWFLAGSCLYCWRDAVRYVWPLAGIALAALVSTLVTGRGSVLVWPLAVPYFAFWFAFHPRINLHRTVEVLGGDYSYGTYLYAFVIQQMIVMRFVGMPPLPLFLMAAPLSILAGSVSWICVERHFMRLKGRSRHRIRMPEVWQRSAILAQPQS
jgi:peptidoglycan/LPS O-acetylase OafA/YrhL